MTLKIFGLAPDRIPAPKTASALETNSPSANCANIVSSSLSPAPLPSST